MATRFITISIEIMHDQNLTANQKFILAEIEQLSQLDNGCVASNQHFSDLTGIAKESVSRCISDLEKKGYITTELINGTRNHIRVISLNKMLRPPKQNVKTPLTKHQETKVIKQDNKTNNISIKEIITYYKENISNTNEKVKETKTINAIVLKKPNLDEVLKGLQNYSLVAKDREEHFRISLFSFIDDKVYLDYQTAKNDKQKRVKEFLL